MTIGRSAVQLNLRAPWERVCPAVERHRREAVAGHRYTLEELWALIDDLLPLANAQEIRERDVAPRARPVFPAPAAPHVVSRSESPSRLGDEQDDP